MVSYLKYEDVFEKLIELNYISHSANDIITSFQNAWNINPKLAIEMLIILRYDCGEKLVFQIICLYLKKTEPAVYQNILNEIPKIGCWKDILQICKLEFYYDYDEEDYLYGYEMVDEVKLFAENIKDPFCAKWAPSENSHYDKLLGFSKYIMDELQLKPREYRKLLTNSRRQLGLIETSLSQQYNLKQNKPLISKEAFKKYKKRLTYVDIMFTRYRKTNSSSKCNSINNIVSQIRFPRTHNNNFKIINKIENACVKMA